MFVGLCRQVETLTAERDHAEARYTAVVADGAEYREAAERENTELRALLDHAVNCVDSLNGPKAERFCVECAHARAVLGNPAEKHRYTVDVILHSVEPYPCIICGGWRQDPRHLENVPFTLPDASEVPSD